MQKQLAAAEKRFKDFMDNHPALQPQAKADMATIKEYVRAEKEYHRKYQELSTESALLTKEFEKVTDITIEEVRNMSREEKDQQLAKLRAHEKKEDAHWEKREAHKQTKPTYPADAYKRMKALRESMFKNDQLHFSK